MSGVPRALATRRLVAPVLVLLVAAGILSALWGGEPRLDLSQTSHGVLPHAWGAAYTLLSELDLGAGRSRRRLSERPPGQTQWLIAPQWGLTDLDDRLAQVEGYAQAGGTVVLFGVGAEVLRPLGLQTRTGEEVDANDPPAAADAGAHAATDDEGGDRPAEDDDDVHYFDRDTESAKQFEAPMLRGTRFVVVQPGDLMDAVAPGARVVVGSKDGALVVERSVGEGRVVAVASERFFDNAHLAEYGHAPFLVDLVRHYGSPTFDEHCHGLLPVGSVTAALGSRWTWLAALSWGALTLAALLRARRWPPPSARDVQPPTPTLEVFVDSLSGLYHQSGRRRAEAVFRAYREGYLRRLHGAHPMSQARFDAQLERQAELLAPVDRGYLLGIEVPGDETELLRAVRALERHAARSPQRSA